MDQIMLHKQLNFMRVDGTPSSNDLPGRLTLIQQPTVLLL